MPVPAGSPPWIMKSGMTRWKMVPSIELVGRFGAGGGMRPLLRAFGELDEVLDGDGRVGLKEADGDLAFGGVEDGVGSWCKCHEDSLIVRDFRCVRTAAQCGTRGR